MTRTVDGMDANVQLIAAGIDNADREWRLDARIERLLWGYATRHHIDDEHHLASAVANELGIHVDQLHARIVAAIDRMTAHADDESTEPVDAAGHQLTIDEV